ncbi:MAG TPA: carbamoyltransferase HypF [Thermosulfurimonas dismutans]|uniref:Carbamoyltransferase n=1 Tax=Thermosulfurimonas dismutans TaxID=999894 RepID=A0A7C3GL20_9BACT|nr:carbamoyltransferase HypF [Thermosulfurimonas dismutans]
MKSLRILVDGRVQGVGFRPFLVRLARRLALSGEVRNVPEGVEVFITGEEKNLRAFLSALRAEAPPLSRIRRISVRSFPEAFSGEFKARKSSAGPPATYVSPDVATCPECLSEIFSPEDRRFGYPFTTCTDCGPRYTVIEALPYDRERTSMRDFPQCPDCLREYRDPASRRFHAETNACPVCGPRILILSRDGEKVEAPNPWEFVIRSLREGAIWALKGLGGFHLACDAENESAVRELRARKHRPRKPFAVMVRDLETARDLAELTPEEAAALTSRRAPIVLSRKKKPFPLAESVAPGIYLVGLMLPYTPLHHLLLSLWPGKALIMTSGNLSGEPLCFENREALSRLSGIADFFLLHDRRIVNPLDDSVVRFSGKTRIVLRRARGLAPDPLPLPRKKSGLLGTGAFLKNTFALTRNEEAFLSPHLGDLESVATLSLWKRTLKSYEHLFSVKPRGLVADLHPDYLSTRLAEEMAQSKGLPLFRLQHHAAHAYSALGERAGGRALALVLDGAGLGTDRTIWGGEVLLLEGPCFRRLARLRPFELPGGEAAEREPWRVALALLLKLFVPDEARRILLSRVPELSEEKIRLVEIQLARGLNVPRTSSAGRLFEALAVILGCGSANSYEGELALRLEGLAAEAEEEEGEGYLVEFDPSSGTIPPEAFLTAALRDLKRGVPRELIARRFHLGLARALSRAAAELSRLNGIQEVALSGGCFQNAIFLEIVKRALSARGLKPVFSEEVPPNDGGISYGQVVWGSLKEAC